MKTAMMNKSRSLLLLSVLAVLFAACEEGIIDNAVLSQNESKYLIVNGHEYVDLGLPSGTLWATMNLGASSISDYGNYYAWGETKTKIEQSKTDNYNEETYKWLDIVTTTDEYGFETTKWTFTKYWRDVEVSGYTGIVDNNTVLVAEDDAATMNWGGSWHTPTHADWNELANINNCTWTSATLNGVNGYKVESKMNDKFIFLPATGYRYDTNYYSRGSYCVYWSSSLYEDYPHCAWHLGFRSGHVGNYYSNRYNGFAVRPVCHP